MVTGSIVLYHSEQKVIERVIDSFGIYEGHRRLFIIDNSEKKTDAYLNRANIEYIFNGKNFGYGTAHNIGIQRAVDSGADYHVVLNPDLSFEPVVIDELVKYADKNRDVVYILPKVISPNGELQYLCKLLPTPFDLIFRRFLPQTRSIKKRNDKYVLKKTGYQKIMNPPCLSGCFMFLRVSALEENDLRFDERFFMYCEDFDFIRRLHRIGKTIYYPEVSIVHEHGQESYKNWKMLRIHMRSACQYFGKYGWVFDKERWEMNGRILNEVKGYGV